MRPSKTNSGGLVVRRTLALSLIVCAAIAAFAALAGATSSLTDRFSASLNRGQEVPKPKGVSILASGRFTATLNGSKLSWKLTFNHLTGAATAAHIHIAVRGKAGPVAVPLCGPCKSGVSKTSVVSSSVVSAMKKGDAYVNVHTVKNPAGEIRGQIRG
jgi:CHRD domain-containing protein